VLNPESHHVCIRTWVAQQYNYFKDNLNQSRKQEKQRAVDQHTINAKLDFNSHIDRHAYDFPQGTTRNRSRYRLA
jgi:hypothetical protein